MDHLRQTYPELQGGYVMVCASLEAINKHKWFQLLLVFLDYLMVNFEHWAPVATTGHFMLWLFSELIHLVPWTLLNNCLKSICRKCLGKYFQSQGFWNVDSHCLHSPHEDWMQNQTNK